MMSEKKDSVRGRGETLQQWVVADNNKSGTNRCSAVFKRPVGVVKDTCNDDDVVVTEVSVREKHRSLFILLFFFKTESVKESNSGRLHKTGVSF